MYVDGLLELFVFGRGTCIARDKMDTHLMRHFRVVWVVRVITEIEGLLPVCFRAKFRSQFHSTTMPYLQYLANYLDCLHY